MTDELLIKIYSLNNHLLTQNFKFIIKKGDNMLELKDYTKIYPNNKVGADKINLRLKVVIFLPLLVTMVRAKRPPLKVLLE